MPSEIIRLKLRNDRCKILNNIQELDEVGIPGLAIWIKDASKVKRVMTKSTVDCVICPEITDKTVLFNYYGRKMVKDRNSLRLLLLDCALPYAVTRYEVVLKTLFFGYPDNKEFVYPKSKDKVENGERDFWVNTYEGKLAITLLSMFDPFKMLSKNKFFCSNQSILCNRIKYILDYIKERNITVDSTSETSLLKYMEWRFSNNRYANFRYDDVLSTDANFIVEDLIDKDFQKKEIYKYVFAIAAYPYIGGNCVEELREGFASPIGSYYDSKYIEANNCIEELLKLKGFADHMYELIAVLSNCYDRKIKCGSSEYEVLKVHTLLKEMLKKGIVQKADLKKEYTGAELINLARLMIENRYMSKVGLFHDTLKFFTAQVGCAAGIVLMDGRSPQMSEDSVTIGNTIIRARCNTI